MKIPPHLPPGLHVFERGWLSANNILFVDDEQSVLVDSGYCTHASQTLSLVETVLGQRPLNVLLNTHLHSDHCGGNAALQERYPQLKTLIPPGHAEQVSAWDVVALTYQPTGQLCPRFDFTDTLKAGGMINLGGRPWEIHAAPGHDPHSLIFFEPSQRLLISADALWEKGFGVVFPELEGTDAFGELGATLDLIESLKPKTVIPGHGRVFHYEASVLALARSRLNSFVQNPLKHARHAAKVLCKFKLLEVQNQQRSEFESWAAQTPYLTHIWKAHFANCPQSVWIEQLCDELVASGAAQRDDAYISNQ